MLKLRALNRESSSDEDGPAIRREAQEEIVLDLYNKALRLQCNEELNEAESIINQLINENIPQLEAEGGLPKTMSTLKFSCYTNLGSVAMKNGEIEKALENYLLASELDNQDVTLWYKIGKLALKLDRFRQAAYAFYMGLECNENHWPCLDELISLLFALRDTVACLKYIGKALILDSNYFKGFILRKSIYDLNKYTEEYYQQFNPDYIYEPNLEVNIDECMEKEVLDEAQSLCDRINEIEKSVASKGLVTIPLPKPLEEFTWLSLGQTIINLHRYITINNMSHFTKVDLKRCMSVIIDDEVKESQTITKEISEQNGTEIGNVVDKEIVIETNENVQIFNENPEDLHLERRLSQFSENDTNEQEIKTPVQTDNDEIEQDVDEQMDQEEQSDSSKLEKAKNQSRTMKRKRDLVSELQIWGWHSKRKSAKKGKFEKDFTIEDAFQRIIPQKLLPGGITIKPYNVFEDSMNTMEIYQLHMEEKTLLTPIHSPLHSFDSNTNYFGTETEKSDVLKFWTQEWSCCDAVNLVQGYVYELSNMWQHKWPEGLSEVYIETYLMFREHFDHPQIFGNNNVDFVDLKKDALVTLLYAELVTYNKQSSADNKIHNSSIAQIDLVSGWKDKWDEEYVSFSMRVHWLKSHLCRKEMQNLLSITALQFIKDLIEEEEEECKGEVSFELILPNCKKYGQINLEIVKKILKNLEMIDSLSRLEELYDKQQYAEVAEILKNTFKSINRPTYKRMSRQAQLAMLLHSLWFIDFADCFVWSEECLCEALGQYLTVKHVDDKWIGVIEKCILIMQEIINKETVGIVDCLSESQRIRLVTSLSQICCKQINTGSHSKMLLGSTVPWILLHYVLLREEHRQQALKKVKKVKKDDSNCDKSMEEVITDVVLPPSIAVLFSAHEFLGPKGWCLTNQGEFLHFIIDTILDRLDTPLLEPLREKIDIHLEQAFFCLYQHPSKKNKVSRHLADHNVNPLPLSWERAQQVYEFFCPDALPEFDSYKSISIPSELEQLLQRIIALVPSECDPQPLVPKITEYLQGTNDTLPTPISFPLKIRSIYYLLGDYHFKQSDVKRSLKYFLLDLCISPLRLDTWACMALGIASQLEYKLTHCERFKTEMEFLDKAKSAEVCFKESLKLSNDHVTLWIEFGSFEYMVHSFCSRVLKYESDTLSMEKFEILENKKDEYLNSSKSSFMRALELYQPDQCEADERWLHHYILAKIAEKQQKEPTEYLEHYYMAATLLEENNACYPDKINYNNPQHLSLEALEVYYRINASILKYLEVHEGKSIPAPLGKTFRKYLELVTLNKTSNTAVQPRQETTESNNRQEEENITVEVEKCINAIIRNIENEEKKNQEKVKDVIMISDSDEDKQESKPPDLTKDDYYGSEVVVIDVSQMEEQMQAAVKQDHNYTEKDEKPKKDETFKEDDTFKQELIVNNEESCSSSSSSDSSSTESDSESTSSSSSSSSVDNNRNLTDSEVLSLVDKCILGLEECIRRLPQNYKALYRLSHLYYHYTKKKDLTKAKHLLLGEYKCKNGYMINGLFADRKNSNFFNGIWRIPSSEIDRPGSLSAHMGRCVNLLLQILRNTNDHKTLLDLCLQLRRIPDADKVYIRHSEREQLSEQALSLCIQTLRNAIKNVKDESSIEKLLIDLFRAYQRSQKGLAHKESVFANMLTETYKKFTNDKLPENANVLDLTIKYCQQNRAAEKVKKQQIVLPSIQKPAPIPVTTSSPVLPASSSPFVNTAPILKRPMARPRGRPPGSKVMSSIRSSRGRPTSIANNPSFMSNMFDQNAAMDYLRKYQKDLLMQYSKTLGMQQIAQMAMNQQNSMAQNTLFLQTMQQMGLLNPQYLNTNFTLQNLFGTKNNEQLINFEHLLQGTSTSSTVSKKSSHLSGTSTKTNSNMGNSTSNSNKMHNIPNNPTKASHSISSAFNSQHKIPSYSVPDNSKFKSPPIVSTSYQNTFSSKLSTKDKDLILKERPSLSITPVQQQTIPSTSPSKSISPGKTLQEKLADKQKQNMNLKNISRNLDFYSTPSTSSLPSILQRKSNPVLPNFAKESGISISHVQLPKSSSEFLGKKDASPTKQKIKVLNTHTNVPISLSVISKPEELKQSDDVIIIE